jgi:hypothetical protein
LSAGTIAAELREAIAAGRHCDASTFHHVERQCIELLATGQRIRTAIFVAAKIAGTLARTLDGEPVEAEQDDYWTLVGKLLADALERFADDPAAEGWVQLIQILYPPNHAVAH